MDVSKIDWLRNRNELVLKTALDNWKCRCGSKLRARDRGVRIEAVCLRSRFWNFWKHDPPRTVLHY